VDEPHRAGSSLRTRYARISDAASSPLRSPGIAQLVQEFRKRSVEQAVKSSNTRVLNPSDPPPVAICRTAAKQPIPGKPIGDTHQVTLWISVGVKVFPKKPSTAGAQTAQVRRTVLEGLRFSSRSRRSARRPALAGR